MVRYLLSRLLGSVPLVLGVLTIIFFLMHVAPGDPTSRYLDPSVSPEMARQLQRNLGLDQPVPVQYVRWMTAFLSGDFGYSLAQRRPIGEILPAVTWNTLQLTVVSLAVTFVMGMVIGVVQALRRGTVSDHVLTSVALFMYSMPAFWLALMLILLFSLKASQWDWWVQLPASQMTSVDHELMSAWGQVRDRIAHLILPATALSLGSAAVVSRYMRSAMLEVMQQDYIRAARAKGLTERAVVFRHALRNALLPVITLLGLTLPYVLGGSVLVETVFAWPGMGRLIVEAVFQRDYPLVMATSFLIAVMVILGNLVADVLYAVADPRIRVR